jgi:hypothetical protein
MELRELVDLAVRQYSGIPENPLTEGIDPEQLYTATPNRLGYVLGWIIASEIVYARFLKSAIDLLPVFHPEAGWDRFLITRRTSAASFAFQPANEFGMLMLDGDDPPRYTSPGGKLRVEAGQAFVSEPQSTIEAILKRIPTPATGEAAGYRIHTYERAPHHPLYMRAVAELIAEYPGLTAAREIYIDDKEIDGQFHPLHLHAAELTSMGPGDRAGANIATTTYRWFQLQYGETFAFFDRRGTRSVYRTDRATWSRVTRQLDKETSVDDVKERIKGWMRLDGKSPSPGID